MVRYMNFWITFDGWSYWVYAESAKVAAVLQDLWDWEVHKILVPEDDHLALGNEQSELILSTV